MTPSVQILESPEQVAARAATLIAGWIDMDSADGPVHIALAGGTTPAATYRQLSGLVDDWSHVHLWFGDERHVPLDSTESNYRAVYDDLIAPSGMGPSNVHPVPTAGDVTADARAYADELQALPADGAGLPVFNVVILGMGADGHVASLFPHSHGLSSRDSCVAVDDSPKPPSERISLSLATLNAADRRLLIVTGSAKATALAASMSQPDPGIPASMLGRDATEVIADFAASALLPHR